MSISYDELASIFLDKKNKLNIQGFEYNADYVIRDLNKRPGNQDIWRMRKDAKDAYNVFQRQIKLEYIKKALREVYKHKKKFGDE